MADPVSDPVIEFEMKDGKSAGVTASKRPWDVYYVNSTVDKNDYAFKVAKNMMNTYGTYTNSPLS